MKLDNPKQAQQFLDDQVSAYKSVGQTLATRVAVNRCMYEGAHWIAGGGDPTPSSSLGRLWTNWRPDSNKLVATLNRIPKLIQECAAATFPDRLDVDAIPGNRDTSSSAAYDAETLSSATNAMIDNTGYVKAARTANFRRSVDGTHGIAWGLRNETRTVKLRSGGEQEVPDQVMRAVSFDSMKLTLDPFVQEMDLSDHNFVIFSEVWPVDRIRRELGLQLDEQDLMTCGQLLTSEMMFNILSQGRLYTNLPMFSKTKGARVHQIHVKDDEGRFSTMLVGVRTQARDVQWINFDNQASPFGGCGLPMTLLHGYPRTDSMWSVSDVAMLKDDQDRLNLLGTFFFRQLQRNASWQWRASRDAMDGMDPDDFKNQFNNYIAGLVTYKQGTRDRPVDKPELVEYPAPQPFVQEAIGMYQEEMRGQVHRPDITIGATKSHVSNQTYQTAMNSANQVLGNRTREDVTRHENMLMIGLGTLCTLAQRHSPSALQMLERAGFDEQDYAVIAGADPCQPAGEIRVRESSVKYQTSEQKEARLWNAVQNQAIPAMDLRMALADMDIAIGDNDRMFFIEAQKAAERVLGGEQWQPMLLGEYAPMFIASFNRAMFDKRVRQDPGARMRLDMAVQGQKQFDLQVQQQEAIAQQPPAPPTPPTADAVGAQPPEEEGPSEADLGQLLNAIKAGAMGGSPQPMAQAA